MGFGLKANEVGGSGAEGFRVEGFRVQGISCLHGCGRVVLRGVHEVWGLIVQG